MVRGYRLRLVVLLVALLCGACSEEHTVPATGLMLVADTDISELERIEFAVESPGRPAQRAEGVVREDGEPLTLGVVREGGPLGALQVSAAGYRQGEKLVERSVVVSFVPNRTVVVPLHLVRSCVEHVCSGQETCTEQGCQPTLLDVEQLSGWQGAPPRLPEEQLDDAAVEDAGWPDMDAGSQQDAGEDAGPDAEVGEEAGADGSLEDATVLPPNNMCGEAGVVDLATNKKHCGECDNACLGSDTTEPVCVDSQCGQVCKQSYGDCDDNLNNGCETSLRSNNNCGSCGMRCKAGQVCLLGWCLNANGGPGGGPGG